jgi:hypothetical protein
MANIRAVHSVGSSIVSYLRNAYPSEVAGRDLPACSFDLVSSGELAGELPETTRVTLYLYRVTVDQHGQRVRPSSRERLPALSVDLHYLLTAWAGSALDEQLAMAWTMRQLHHLPVLDLSVLSPDAGWSPDEVVQVVPAELSTEDVMRIWDGLEPAYRLSTSYVARVVRLDPDEQAASAPVIARRLSLGSEEHP